VKIVPAFGALTLSAIAAGCGARMPANDTTPVPPPPIAQLLPTAYQATKVFDADLTGGTVPDKVVTAIGPERGELKLRPATVEVITWNPDQKRWTAIFDAQKTMAPDTYGDPRTSNSGPGADPDLQQDEIPLLDPEAAVELETVDTAPMLSTRRDQLVLSAWTNFGGSGVPEVLAVLDFEHAKPRVLYAWRGEHLEVELDGARILATSSYWERGDSHCCPARDYHFTVGRSGDRIVELEDQRPYLGVLVETTDPNFIGPYRVLEVTQGSPAEGRLQVGDLLKGVENARSKGDRTALYRQLGSFDAGETARIVVERNGTTITVPVELGSLKDAVVLPVMAEDDTIEAL